MEQNCCKCKEPMVDKRVPIKLECNHQICIECVGIEIAKLAPQDQPDQIPCPVCKLSKNLTQSVAQILAMSVQVYFQKNQVHKEIYHCDKHKDMPIEWFCIKCKKYICYDCWDDHKDHRSEVDRMTQKMIKQTGTDLIKEIDAKMQTLADCKQNLSKIVNFEILHGDDIQKHFKQAMDILLSNNSKEMEIRIKKISQVSCPMEKLDSLIVKAWHVQQILKSKVPNAKSFKLAYRFTRDGNLKEFHKLCDGIAPTLSILKADNDSVFGAYTDIAWRSSGKNTKGNGNTFLFKMKQEDDSIETFKNIKGKPEVFHHSDQLTFGADSLCVYDLGITTNTCFATLYEGHFEKPKNCQDVNSYLAGKTHFGIKEIEVFKCVIN